MDLHALLRTRRSVRRFKADPVADSAIERILTSAIHAPSAHNRQPWRFCVVTTLVVKQRLAEKMSAAFQAALRADGLSAEEIEKQVNRSHARILSAPLIIVACLDPSELDVYPDQKRNKAEYIMAVQSVAAAMNQLLLAAHAEGLGGVWVCSPLFAPEAVSEALELSPLWEPQGMCFVGYADVVPALRERKSLDSIVIGR